MIIKFLKINEKAVMPSFAHATDAGIDVCSVETAIIKARSFLTISTGLVAIIPKGFEIQVRSRSGLAAKHGVFVLNGVGTIDCGYQGELKVVLANFSDVDYKINIGDRIAQLVVSKLQKVNIVESFVIKHKSKRGIGGFGSTGK